MYKFKPVVVLDGREGFAASSAEWLSSSWHVFADKLFCDGSMLLAVSAFPRRRARGKEAKKARCAALTPLYLGFKFYLCAPESTRERERGAEGRDWWRTDRPKELSFSFSSRSGWCGDFSLCFSILSTHEGKLCDHNKSAEPRVISNF